MGSINDWAAKTAERICYEVGRVKRKGDGVEPDVASKNRIAAIIATFAEPLVALLREARRGHHHEEDDAWYCCGACTHECEAVEEDQGHEHDESCCVESTMNRVQGICDCGADAWNAKVDAALAGQDEPIQIVDGVMRPVPWSGEKSVNPSKQKT